MSRHTTADKFRKRFGSDPDPELPVLDELGEEAPASLKRGSDGRITPDSFRSTFGVEEADTDFDIGNKVFDIGFTIDKTESEQPPSFFDPTTTIVEAITSLDDDPSFREIWAKAGETAASILTAPEYISFLVETKDSEIARMVEERGVSPEAALVEYEMAFGNLPNLFDALYAQVNTDDESIVDSFERGQNVSLLVEDHGDKFTPGMLDVMMGIFSGIDPAAEVQQGGGFIERTMNSTFMGPAFRLFSAGGEILDAQANPREALAAEAWLWLNENDVSGSDREMRRFI